MRAYSLALSWVPWYIYNTIDILRLLALFQKWNDKIWKSIKKLITHNRDADKIIKKAPVSFLYMMFQNYPMTPNLITAQKEISKKK